MFDVGFSEMLVIGIVALVVIGPEKLPRVARTVGALLGRMQRYVNDVKADINREMELDELKKLQTTVQDAATSIQTSMNETVSGFQSQADEVNKIVSGDIAGLAENKPVEAGAAGDSVASEAASATPGLTAADTAVAAASSAAMPAVSGSPAMPATGGSATAASAAVPATAENSQSPAAESGSHQASQASLFAEPAPTNDLGAVAPSKPVATV